MQLVVITQHQVQVYPFDVRRGSGTADIDPAQPGDARSVSLTHIPGRLDWSSLSQTGKLALAINLQHALVVDLAKPDADVLMLNKNTNRINISPNGQWLAAFGDSESGVCVLDANTGQVVRDLAAGDLVAYAAFSPDGKWLVADRGTDVLFYEVGRWNLSHRTSRGEAELPNFEQCFSFAADGKMLLSGSRTSERFELIRTSDGSTITSFEQPIGPACLSPTGSKIVFVNRDFTLDVLDLDHIARELTEAGLEFPLWFSGDK